MVSRLYWGLGRVPGGELAEDGGAAPRGDLERGGAWGAAPFQMRRSGARPGGRTHDEDGAARVGCAGGAD